MNFIQKLLLCAGVFLHFSAVVFAQQIHWAKVYPLPKRDIIYCIAQDHEGNLYAAGGTERNIPGDPFVVEYTTFLMKLTSDGDTIYTKEFGYGSIVSMAVDYEGNIRLNVLSESVNVFVNRLLILMKMSPEGFVFHRDTIPSQAGFIPWGCTVGKDSSLIVVGRVPRTINPSQQSMFFLRVQKDGIIDPWVELNPGHPNCVANRVEQLPNGHYLVSGYVGSRIASYELDEWGLTSTFKQWYQTPDFSNLNSGYVGRLGNSQWSVAGNGIPSVVGVYNSMDQKIWLRKQTGPLAPPQGMTDSTIVFGYNSSAHPIYRFGFDSTLVWYLNLRDSLEARGFPNGNVGLTSITNFEDQSAVVAGKIQNGAFYQDDPIFIRISNVGTPVTSLSKPKKGSLANETLAPWPNPTGGTLYFKQHFDKAEVHFFSLSGKEVGHYQIRFGQPIDVSGFPAGVYLYRANIDGKAFSGKVIKN